MDQGKAGLNFLKRDMPVHTGSCKLSTLHADKKEPEELKETKPALHNTLPFSNPGDGVQKVCYMRSMALPVGDKILMRMYFTSSATWHECVFFQSIIYTAKRQSY